MKQLGNWRDLNREEKTIRVLWIWIIVIVPLYIIVQSSPESDSIFYILLKGAITFLYMPWIVFPFIIWGLSKKNKKKKMENDRIELLKQIYKDYSRNYFDENRRDMARGKVLDAPNKLKIQIMKRYEQYLIGMDYIYVDEESGWDYITHFTKSIKVVQGRINTLFWKHCLVESLYAPKKRVFLLALDTNIVSYIKRYVDGTLDKQFYPIINSLKRCKEKNIEINIDAYILENCILELNIGECEFDNILQAYYFIYSINYNSKIAKLKAQEKLNKLKKDFEDPPHDLCKKQERYSYVYCVLLKIIILKFEEGALKEKAIRLINFMNEETCTLDPALGNLAYAYWEKGEKIRFFGTIQRKRKDILKQIRNMAWDLYHLFNTSLSYQKENDLSTLYYPIFYTNDNRLADIGETLKLQGVAIDNISNQVFPHYIENVWKKILTIEEQHNYLGYDKLRKRNARRKEVDTMQLYKKLEIELLALLEYRNI